jgi:integrase/recombinase XerC
VSAPVNDSSASWLRSLRARNLAVRTQGTYRQSVEQLAAWLETEGVVTVDEVRRRHVEDFIADLAQTRSASTASVRFRALQQFFNWCADEDELSDRRWCGRARRWCPSSQWRCSPSPS